ncbi:MAG: hypothetical protein JKY51_06860 [Opitutaceae bacterium]|nr:hypothetical protein [Opitutaceae bacterium]
MNQHMIKTHVARKTIVSALLPAPMPTTIAAAKLTKAKQVAIKRAGMVEHSLLD